MQIFFRNSFAIAKLPLPSKRFELNTVPNYYQDILGLIPFNFKFSNVIQDLILQLLKDMNIDKAAGVDNLPGKFLKDGANILAKPISKICNISMKHSLFSTDCQIAKLKPLCKKGSATLPKNYRPISLLTLISKIIKRVVHDQTQAFLDENKILYHFNSGFFQNFSTDSCLSYLNN